MHANRTVQTVMIASGIGLSALAITASQPERPASPPVQTTPRPPEQPETRRPDTDRPQASVTQETLDKATKGWDDGQLTQIKKLTQKYGMPTDAGPNAVAWVDAAPFSSIVIYRETLPHRFPVEHSDFLQHTIHFKVPADKASDLIASDGSLRLDRTAGTISAKCDTEAHNILSLNLAHDILTGTKSVDQARQEHTRIVMSEQAGETHPYLEKLQFEPQTAMAARDPDEPGPGANRGPNVMPASDRPAPPPR